MKKPLIISVDDDIQVLKALRRDLRNEYREDYKIITGENPNEVLELVEELKKNNEEVALFISDQRMPEMEGVDFLEKVKEFYPDSKRVLLTAYSETDAAIKAINEVQLDYYLLKPWDPPNEKLYPIINDLLDQWNAEYVPEFTGLKVIGYQFSPKSHSIKDFLSGNLFPFQWIDIEKHEKAEELKTLHKLDVSNTPYVILENGELLTNPSNSQLAEKIGLSPNPKESLYDVAIIGAGPAGLAAAVYGGSEGLKTVLIEKRAPGGQAGTSSRIENYLGFPKGLSGADLSRRAITQATRFGIEFLNPQVVKKIEIVDDYKVLMLEEGKTLKTKSVVITTGVDYRKLEKPGMDKFTGAGIYYGAATTEASSCQDGDVFIVGGGNSAGQAAMYLSRFARKVNILIRRESLASSMSSYLIDQINDTKNIEVIPFTEVSSASGTDHLESITIKNKNDGSEKELSAVALFIFIGARPYTDWVGGEILKNERGFILTGSDLMHQSAYKANWKENRDPFLLETSKSGIFAAGDVRANAMNRVASAVGEGAMSISFVHKYLENF